MIISRSGDKICYNILVGQNFFIENAFNQPYFFKVAAYITDGYLAGDPIFLLVFYASKSRRFGKSEGFA